MKKIVIMLIAILVVSVGFLSGCNEQKPAEIKNKPPIVSISADSTFVYRTLAISITIDSEDTDGIVSSCLVDFGDGNIKNGFNFSYTYEEAGIYLIIATVTDDDGADSSCNMTITVEEPLSLSIDADVTRGTFPLTVSFMGLAEDAIGNITGFYWDFGDGTTSNEQNPSHTFETPNTYTTSLTVSNSRKENISESITIIAEHRPSFKISGKIVNNYDEKIEVDYAVVEEYNNWDYWAPTLIMSPYEEKDYSCDVKTGYQTYLFWVQWFYLGTSTEGSDIAQYEITNPLEENMVLYAEIKSDGDVEISTTYHPPNPPKTPEITAHNAYSYIYNTYVFGKIKNIDPSSIKSVRIGITLYDSSNNVISQKTEYPFVSLIGSQLTSSFSTFFYYEDYYHHYDIKIESFETANEQPYTGLVITNDYQETDWLGWLYVKGEIENVGSQVAKNVKVNAVFYDSGGSILTTEYDLIGDLYSGEKEPFEITLYPSDLDKLPSSISSYELEIDYDL